MNDALDLAELRASIRAVLDREADAEHVRRHVAGDAAHDEALARSVAPLGWAGLAIAEDDGGLGLGIPALAVLHEELGRGPAPLPLLSTLLAADALGDAPAEIRSAWLPRIAAGEAFAAFAPGSFAGERIDGRIEHVLDGQSAACFVIGLAGGWAGVVARDAPGVTVEATPCVDRTRSLAALVLRQAPVARFKADFARLERHAALGLACDSVGGAEAVLGKTVAFLNTRIQFGQPIGKFQALKHRAAEHKLRLEEAQALVAHAVALDSHNPAALAAALLAQATATSAYLAIADDSVQLHGGMGFTWEQECHHYLKRAWLNRSLFGGETQALDRAARLLTEVA